jgi:hypothetical protein
MGPLLLATFVAAVSAFQPVAAQPYRSAQSFPRGTPEEARAFRGEIAKLTLNWRRCLEPVYSAQLRKGFEHDRAAVPDDLGWEAVTIIGDALHPLLYRQK